MKPNIRVVELHVVALVAAIFYLAFDVAMSLHYANKYQDKDWNRVRVIGLFTKSLKMVMKKNHTERLSGPES